MICAQRTKTRTSISRKLCCLKSGFQILYAVEQFSSLLSKEKLKQGAHIHQPTAWPLPHACAQPYHAGSGSHGQLFRHYWSTSAWHSLWSVTGANSCIKRPFPAETSPLSASSTRHLWELLAGNRTAVLPRHAQGRRIMGLVYVCPLL